MISLSVAVRAETGEWKLLFLATRTSYLELFRYIAPIHPNTYMQVCAFTCPRFVYVLVGSLVARADLAQRRHWSARCVGCVGCVGHVKRATLKAKWRALLAGPSYIGGLNSKSTFSSFYNLDFSISLLLKLYSRWSEYLHHFYGLTMFNWSPYVLLHGGVVVVASCSLWRPTLLVFPSLRPSTGLFWPGWRGVIFSLMQLMFWCLCTKLNAGSRYTMISSDLWIIFRTWIRSWRSRCNGETHHIPADFQKMISFSASLKGFQPPKQLHAVLSGWWSKWQGLPMSVNRLMDSYGQFVWFADQFHCRFAVLGLYPKVSKRLQGGQECCASSACARLKESARERSLFGKVRTSYG